MVVYFTGVLVRQYFESADEGGDELAGVGGGVDVDEGHVARAPADGRVELLVAREAREAQAQVLPVLEEGHVAQVHVEQHPDHVAPPERVAVVAVAVRVRILVRRSERPRLRIACCSPSSTSRW